MRIDEKRRRGRPPGVSGTCSFCGDSGHAVRGGTCSRVAVAERLVREQGLTGSEASRIVGCSRQAVSQRLVDRSKVAP